MKSLILTENPDIIAICEAKPKNGALRGNVECKITGFNTMHVNMNQEQNRGIIIYIKESMAHATVQLNLEMFQKACIIKIMLKDNTTFCCFVAFIEVQWKRRIPRRTTKS